jgi:hypothetical protein
MKSLRDTLNITVGGGTAQFNMLRTMALIEDGVVTNKIKADPIQLPDWVDVTDIECGIGWIANEDGSFTKPPIRVLAVQSFLQRFTQAERIAIRNSTDDIVVDLYELIKVSTYINLDDPNIGPGLLYISGQTDPAITSPIIDPLRIPDLMADGTDEEAHNGIL